MKILKRIFEEISFFGGLIFSSLIGLFILFYNEYLLFIKYMISLFIIYSFTIIIRYFYFKERPEKMKYNNKIEKIDSCSFPSVHAARATFLLIFFLNNFYLKKLIIVTLFIIYFSVLYSRMYLKKHYLVDILAGILLGAISSIILLI